MPAQPNGALAEVLSHPLIVGVIERAKAQTGDARKQSLKTLFKALGDNAAAYVAAGGPLADELATHLPAAKAKADEKAKATKPPQVAKPAPSEGEPAKWIKPTVPKKYKGADVELKSVGFARKCIEDFADDGSQIAFSIGWSKIPCRFICTSGTTWAFFGAASGQQCCTTSFKKSTA